MFLNLRMFRYLYKTKILSKVFFFFFQWQITSLMPNISYSQSFRSLLMFWYKDYQLIKRSWNNVNWELQQKHIPFTELLVKISSPVKKGNGIFTSRTRLLHFITKPVKEVGVNFDGVTCERMRGLSGVGVCR